MTLKYIQVAEQLENIRRHIYTKDGKQYCNPSLYKAIKEKWL